MFNFNLNLVWYSQVKWFYRCILKIDYHDYYYDNHDHDGGVCMQVAGVHDLNKYRFYLNLIMIINETHSVGSFVPLQFLFYFLSFTNMSGDEKRRIQNGKEGILVKKESFSWLPTWNVTSPFPLKQVPTSAFFTFTLSVLGYFHIFFTSSESIYFSMG